MMMAGSALGLVEKIRDPNPSVLQQPEEQTDIWDDDFEEGISFSKLQGMFSCHLSSIDPVSAY